MNVFRYLAKILACQIAEVKGPRFVVLTEFALGKSKRNVIQLTMDADPGFRTWFEVTGDPQFAGHGGLEVDFSRRNGRPKEIVSTLTHGALRYRFSVAFGPVVAIALRFLHPVFYATMKKAFDDVIAVERASGSS